MTPCRYFQTDAAGKQTLPETAFITVVQDVDMSMARDFWNEDSSDTNVLASEQSLSMRLLQALLVRYSS
jgi:hypothetical protein